MMRHPLLLLPVLALPICGALARAPARPGPATASPPPRHATIVDDSATCLAMLPDDPDGAADYAADWSRRGGGSAASQCGALARMAAGDPVSAARTLDALSVDVSQPPQRRAILAEQAGQAWLSAAQPTQALASESRAASLAPQDPAILALRGRAALDADQPRQALPDLDSSLRLDPRQPDALVARAETLRRLGRPDAARTDIEAADALVPRRPDILLERGVLREAAGDRDGARADWNAILADAPDTREADVAQQDLALLDAGPEAK